MKQEISNTRSQETSPAQPAKNQKPEKNLYEPYSTPRVLYEMIRWTARFLFAIIANVRLRGRYNVPKKGPYIIASNHLRWLDVPFVPAYVPSKVVYMAKEETFHSKYGWLVRFLGAFPVKRGEADRRAIRAAGEQLKQGKVFIIFPEGTRSKTHTLAKAHDGLGMIALRAGVPVIPVAIWGSEKVFKQFRPTVTVSYGEPITFKPSGPKMTREDIQNSTDTVMRRIAAMMPPEYRGAYADAVQETPGAQKQE